MDCLVQDLCKLPLFQLYTRNITTCFSYVGYVPFTSNFLKSPYIRRGLGEEGDETLPQHLVQIYEESKIDLLNKGFRVEGIFDAGIPKATKL